MYEWSLTVAFDDEIELLPHVFISFDHGFQSDIHHNLRTGFLRCILKLKIEVVHAFLGARHATNRSCHRLCYDNLHHSQQWYLVILQWTLLVSIFSDTVFYELGCCCPHFLDPKEIRQY